MQIHRIQLADDVLSDEQAYSVVEHSSSISLHDLESPHLGQSGTVNSSPRRPTSLEQQKLVFLPLHHQGAELIMLLDGGYNASIIYSHAVARLNLKIVHEHVMGRGAAKGSNFVISGIVKGLHIAYAKHTGIFDLRVMEGHDDYDGILGIDQMAKLGLGYTGLVGSDEGITDKHNFHMAPVQSKPAIASGESRLLADELVCAVGALNNDFIANEKLQPQNPCTHSASIIWLEGKDGPIAPIF
jgi:hypothetical protein